MRITVIGAGVIGLSCAIRLREAGHDAQIVARQPALASTSSVAAAIWYPYLAEPKERVLGWGSATFNELASLAAQPATGVLMREGIELFPSLTADPWWRTAVPGVRRASPSELPAGYADGFVFTVPLIEMPRYLPYLVARFAALGGSISLMALASLDEAPPADVLVDCAGLGARELAHDHQLYAVRGQVVRVSQVGIDRFWLDDYGPRGLAYIVPRRNDIILGGTADPGNEHLEPDPAIAAAIVERCAALEPRLRHAAILEHKVGLRPGRATVRLEAETHNRQPLVHCYGHGGAGVTLSWGCAADVLALVQAMV